MKYVFSVFTIVLFCFSNIFAQTSTENPAQVVPVPETSASPLYVTPANEPQAAIDNPVAESSASKYVSKKAAARIPRFDAPPTIDGQLNDSVWAKAAMFGEFLQTQPGDNVTPPHPTEVMMGYDAKNLYLAFRVKQDKDKVRATVARRDNIFNDDFVGVFLDTFNDQRQAYVFFFNPLGIQADGTLTEGRGEDYSVDIVMESKGVLTEDGYTIEAAITV